MKCKKSYLKLMNLKMRNDLLQINNIILIQNIMKIIIKQLFNFIIYFLFIYLNEKISLISIIYLNIKIYFSFSKILCKHNF